MTKPLLEFRGRVVSIERELIPKMHLCRIESDDKKIIVEMDLHEDIVLYNIGDELYFALYRENPVYIEGKDFVGKATVASIKEGEDKYSILLSIGGLLTVIHISKSIKLELTPTEKIYLVVSRERSRG